MVKRMFLFGIVTKSMDWFLYDNGLRHERVKHYVMSEIALNIVNEVSYPREVLARKNLD